MRKVDAPYRLKFASNKPPAAELTPDQEQALQEKCNGVLRKVYQGITLPRESD